MLTKPTKKQLGTMMADALLKESGWKSLKLSDHTPTTGSTCITYEHRSDILEWLLAVSNQYRFYPESYALSVAILDRFLLAVKVQPKYLKCIALTCLNIAAKICEEDEIVPHVGDFITHSGASCTVADCVRMEMIVLNKLGWDVNLVTSLHFLQMFHAYLFMEYPDLLAAANLTPSRHLSLLTVKLNQVMMSSEACQWQPSLIAVSLLSLELECFRVDWFPLTLQLLKLIQLSDFSRVISCRENMSIYLLEMNYDNVQTKFSNHKRSASMQRYESSKRKMEDRPEPEEFFESIKRLYNEDGAAVATPSVVMMPED